MGYGYFVLFCVSILEQNKSTHTLVGCVLLPTREDIEISYTNYTKQTRFESVSSWSESETIDLMEYHLGHERRLRRGWSNNLSLVNHSIGDGDTSHSLLAWQVKPFEKMLLLIIPFRVSKDVRNLQRMYTTFSMIRGGCRAFSQSSGSFIVGDELNNIIQLLIDRIINGFGWNQYSCGNNLIRRYRLVKVLENNKCTLSSYLDCHHLIGHSSHPSEHIIDDRSKNIVILDKLDHCSLHNDMGDTNFVDYRLL
jgi:hypothetical protein